MLVVGLGIERLNLYVGLTLLNLSCGAGLNRLACLDHADSVDGLVVLNDTEALGKLVV